MSERFPARAFVQSHHGGRLPPESDLVVAELTSRSIPVIIRTTEEILLNPLPLTDKDLVVGDFDWTRTALKQLNIPLPCPPDYPPCLQHLLNRNIWQSTLGDVQMLFTKDPAAQLFMKPASDIKAFSGLVVSPDWIGYFLEQFPSSFPVLCSDLVDIIAEFRVYVVHGAVRAICHYKGPKDVAPDLEVVYRAVKTFSESNDCRAGCGMDFAVMKKQGDGGLVTGLIEVNEGFSLGAYEGLSGKDYTDMLVARWHQLVTTKS